jgi:hypothetical protein
VVNSTNFLDAYWIGGVAKIRILGVAEFIDSSFDFVVAVNDTAGTYPCPAGGSVTFARSTTQISVIRTLTFANCDFGSELPVVVKSGSVTSPDAVARFFTAAGGTLLQSGHFQFTDLVYATTDTGSPGFGADDRITSGVVSFERSGTDLSVMSSGFLNFTRNGRTDQYAAISIHTNPGITTGGAVDIVSGSLNITTPRFASSILAVSGDATTLSVSGSDQSFVSGTVAAGPGITYQVFTAPATAAVLTQTLANSDTAVQAAVARALQ